MISKFLRYTLLVCLISLVMLAVIPGDPKNSVLLGFSAFRLLMLVGFFLLLVVFAAGIYILKNNPPLEHKINQKIECYTNKPRCRELILIATSLVILTCSVLVIVLVMTTNQYVSQILLRLLPVFVFVLLVGFQVLSLDPLKADRKKWVAIIALSLLCMLVGIGLQTMLLGDLDMPYPRNSTLIQVSNYATVLLAFTLLSWLANLSPRNRWTWILLVLFVTLTFLIQWELFPNKYWRTKHFLAIFAPPGILGTTLLTLVVFNFWHRIKKDGVEKLRLTVQWGAIVLLLLLSIPYFNAAKKHSQILNDSTRYTDQSNYLEFAKKARQSSFTYLGEHNQTAAYPFLQALFYRSGMDDSAFFEQGKLINIVLSLVLLVALFLIFIRYLSVPSATILTLIVAFGFYIFKAPYFQAEVLYYFLAFLGFFLMAKMILKPGLALAVVTGVVLGLAQHTKASVLPALAMFVFVYLSKEIVYGLRMLRRKSYDRERIHKSVVRLAYLLITVICFLTVIYPYIRVTKQRFGQYFYNVNTSVYIWYDDFVQAKAAEEIYNFTDQWPPDMPAEMVPGLQNYLRTHSIEQIIDRIRFGVNQQIINIQSQFSVTNYQLTFMVLLLMVIMADLKNSINLLLKYPYLVGFSILYFAVYMTAFIWYSPISPERRFTYGLFIPLMFAIFVAIKELVANQRKNADQETSIELKQFVSAAYFVVALTLIINIWLVLSERMFFDRYGS